MKPYNGNKSKHRTINRDDIHHKTQDGGNNKKIRKKYAKRARKAARQNTAL